MRILFLCTFYHTARIFHELRTRLSKQGHTVRVFNAVSMGSRLDSEFCDSTDADVTHAACFTRWDRFLYTRKQEKIRRALLSQIDPAEYDLIHSHNLLNGGLVARSLSREMNVPYVVSVRNTDLNVFLKLPVFRPIARRIADQASGIHFLSEPYRERFLALCGRGHVADAVRLKADIIYNGVEDYWLDNRGAPRSLGNRKELRLLAVGRIDKNKNHLTTVDAVARLASHGYQASLTIVGPVVDSVIARRLQSVPLVRLVGYLPKEHLLDVYRQHDILVMPSRHETFGRVYAEAMTQGLPVIYSREEGFDGLFEDGCVGYATPCDDASCIADRIRAIADDYSGISSRCVDLCQTFDWTNIALKLQEFYERALCRTRGEGTCT